MLIARNSRVDNNRRRMNDCPSNMYCVSQNIPLFFYAADDAVKHQLKHRAQSTPEIGVRDEQSLPPSHQIHNREQPTLTH